MKISNAPLLYAAVISLSVSPLSAFTFLVNDNLNIASDSIGFGVQTPFQSKLIPTDQTVTVTDGSSSSSTRYMYSGVGDNVSLSAFFTQSRAGALNSATESMGTLIRFTVDTDSTYRLLGEYTVDDVGPTSGFVRFSASLRDGDEVSGTLLLRTEQRSSNTVDEQLRFGEFGGDQLNTFSGSLTGMMLAGHTYTLTYDAVSQANPDADTGMSARGAWALDIGDGAPLTSVPDSGSTAAMLTVALAGVFAIRRRQIGGAAR
jgi:hypothetical protein